MTEQTKTCRRCGAVKPLTQFRKYYGNRKGHYTFCQECERLETRRKYLSRKELLTPDELYELQAIKNLYEARERIGLPQPKARSSKSRVLDIVEQRLTEISANEDV